MKPLSNGLFVVAGGIRVQGRLKATGVSPFTMDDVESIRNMLATLKGKQRKRN